MKGETMKKLFLGAIVGVVSTVVYQKYLAEKAAPYVEKCKEQARKAYETAKTKLHEATCPKDASAATE